MDQRMKVWGGGEGGEKSNLRRKLGKRKFGCIDFSGNEKGKHLKRF